MTSKYNILIVDDDAWSLCILENIVKNHASMTIFKAENGYAALEIMEQEKIDFLVTDFSMPGMNGTTLMKEGLAVHPDLITVIQSAANELATALDTIKNGAFDFISKPLDPQHLLFILDKCIDKKILEQKLKAQSEKLHLLMTAVEQSTASIVITDRQGLIQYVNPHFCVLTGYTVEEAIGNNPRFIQSGDTAPELYKEMWQTILAGQIWKGEIKNRKKNGELYWERMTISPIYNVPGASNNRTPVNAPGMLTNAAITNFIAIKEDITEMVNLQRQLLQAQKLEAIGQLAAGIAHEINTPMQFIQSNVMFMEKSCNDLQPLLFAISKMPRSLIDAETAALLDTVDLDYLMGEIPLSIKETYEGINRVVKIISAMKTFSHPGGTAKVAADLNSAVESTIIVSSNEWKHLAEMITEFDPDLPMVSCFPDQLNQVILNLIINAVHAIEACTTPLSAGQLGAITVATRTDGDWVEIQVSDSGCGIPEAIQPHIFEPFFTTKEVGKGTGQGLALAHDIIVNKHGGRIDFTSTPGQGTTFTIRLPIAL